MKMQGFPPEWAWSQYALPDARGHFGPYGGVFVAETLRGALDELTLAYSACREDPEFQRELAWELEHYVGRPSPIFHARGLVRRRTPTTRAASRRAFIPPRR